MVSKIPTLCHKALDNYNDNQQVCKSVSWLKTQGFYTFCTQYFKDFQRPVFLWLLSVVELKSGKACIACIIILLMCNACLQPWKRMKKWKAIWLLFLTPENFSVRPSKIHGLCQPYEFLKYLTCQFTRCTVNLWLSLAMYLGTKKSLTLYCK